MTDFLDLRNRILQALAGDGDPEKQDNWKSAAQIAQELNEPLEEVKKVMRRICEWKEIRQIGMGDPDHSKNSITYLGLTKLRRF